MPTYFLRLPSRTACAVGLFGGGAVLLCYGLWDVYSTRRNAVPLFDSGAVVRTEEAARYPCHAIRGFDVVVRSFYVPTSAAQDGGPGPSPSSWSAVAAVRRFGRLFSNETHRVDGVDAERAAETPAAAGTEGTAAGAAASVRLVVRDAADAAAVAGGNGACVAAAQWPPGTAKYAALVLEPSPDRADADAPARSLLRQLADGATHQSLVRCNPRSTQLDMACEGDAAYLGAPYLRVLLSAFLLLPTTVAPLNVAVLGVGGGSLPLFLQRYFAQRLHRCDLVDVEPMCIKAAVEQLGLKESLNAVALRREGGGVQYYIEDASVYLRRRMAHDRAAAGPTARHHGTPIPLDTAETDVPMSLATSTHRHCQLDVLFIDLFVGSELDAAVTSPAFLRQCRAALSAHGVAAFNTPAADVEFVRRCAAVFGADNVYRIPVPASSNEVVLARGGEAATCVDGARLSHRHFFRRAQALTAQYRLPYDLANHYPVWWRVW